MAIPTKTKLPIATHDRTNLDLSGQHATTSDFLQLGVSKCLEMVPNQSINITHKCFSRLDPLVAPTFGGASIQHRAFFVPMRVIFPGWNEFITDVPRQNSLTGDPEIASSVPSFKNNTLVSILFDAAEIYSQTVETETESDFTYTQVSTVDNSQTSRVYRKFTPFGKFVYKLLRSLGYAPIFTNANKDTYSAMPLLAIARVYYDYYYPSQYFNDEDSAFLQSLFCNQTDNNHTYIDNTQRLSKLFNILYHIPYPADYFTSAWDTPSAPSVGHFSDIQMNDSTSTNIIGTPYTETQEFAGTVEIYNTGISQFAINALKSLTDYMKRHQIVGSKALDRYLSRFGVKLSNEKLNRSVIITEYNQNLEFGDVTSTADTEGANLGSYAGKGLSYGDGSFDFQTDEYGYLFIISTITPYVQYYQGMDRKVLHLTRFDFFTPELDNLGTQALGCKELYAPTNTDNYLVDYDKKIFGFVPRYAEYKVPMSQLTGDLSLNSQKTSNEPWTLYRDMSIIYNVSEDNPATSFDNIHHGIDFVMAKDNLQYNRIFQVPDPNIDHFKMIHNFNIKSSFPGKSLYNDYNFEGEDKAEKVTVGVGGENVMN